MIHEKVSCYCCPERTVVDFDPVGAVFGPVAVGLALHRRHALLAVRAVPDVAPTENVPVEEKEEKEEKLGKKEGEKILQGNDAFLQNAVKSDRRTTQSYIFGGSTMPRFG